MKLIKVFLTFIFIITLFFLISCEKDQENIETLNYLTEEIGKIETSYKEGDIKIENINDGNKIENDADFSLKDKIRNELEASYSKTHTFLKSGSNTVGVFKSGSCGSWPVLDIFMDCEDNNPQTSTSGWIGDSYRDGNKNVHFQFCVVNNAYFEHTNIDFAVVNLTANLPWGVSRIARYFDNEDKNNTNSVTYNGNRYSGLFGDCWFGGNTRLSFYYYPKTTYQRPFPSLGISYGVLGRFGSNQGSIYTDDEDKDNKNWCYLELFDNSSYSYIKAYSGDIANIMDVGRNTRLYLSKVY